MLMKHISGDWWAVIASALILFLSSILEKYWRLHRQARSQTWPLIYGQVSRAAVFRGKYDATLTLWYSYPAPDEPYPIPAEFQKDFSSVDEAQLWADVLFDKTVPVRVNPLNSWKSQLWDCDLEAIVKSTVPHEQVAK